MNATLRDDTLVLHFEGEINSANANAVDQEAVKAIGNKKFAKLILDFDKVPYISSAGLRIVLSLKKKYGSVEIEGVVLEVYDVLQMTGFTEIMPVRRRINEVDLSHAELIGQGFFSLVYRLDKDTIVKLFRQAVEVSEVERELNLAKQAFVLGIPTAISFDVVRSGDKLGVRFEMLDCASLRDIFRDHPEKYDEMVRKYAELVKIINTTESFDPEIPDAKAFWVKKLDKVKPFIDETRFDKLRRLFESVPERDSFVHGDCHVKNVMVQDGNLMLIDMDTLSKGHPIFELAGMYATYVAFEEDHPGNSEEFLGLKKELIHKIFKDVLDIYFDGIDEETYRKIALVSYAHMVWWTVSNTPDDLERRDNSAKRLCAMLDVVDDLDIGK